MRVVSLLPSATELVCLVGGADMLVGRSHECDFPEHISHLPVLTGAKNAFISCAEMNDTVTATLSRGEGLYDIDGSTLRQLSPDIIVTQSLCNVCSVDLRLVQQLVDEMHSAQAAKQQQQLLHTSCNSHAQASSNRMSGTGVPHIISLNPFSIEDVLTDALRVGEALGLQQQAAAAVDQLRSRLQAAQQFVAGQPPLEHPVVAFCEWVEPIFPGGHWTPQLIHMAGGMHPLNPPRGPGQAAGPSLAVYNTQLAQLDPDLIIICPCGLNIQETLQQLPPVTCSSWWKRLKAVQQGRVVLVDGNSMFNRPGPRLVDAFEFLVGLLHERHDFIPQGFPWRFLDKDELLAAEADWLNSHPDWQTRVQHGPPQQGGQCCSGSGCAPPAVAASAAAAPADS